MLVDVIFSLANASGASGQTGEKDSNQQGRLWHLEGDWSRNLQRGERVCAGSVMKQMIMNMYWGVNAQVALARMRNTQQVYALKIMNKWDMLKRGEVNAQRTTKNSVYRLHKAFSVMIRGLCAFRPRAIRRSGRFCWRETVAGSLSCITLSRTTITSYVSLHSWDTTQNTTAECSVQLI